MKTKWMLRIAVVLLLPIALAFSQAESVRRIPAARLSRTHTTNSAAALDERISITLDDVELVDVIKMITRISGFDCVVNPEELRRAGRVTVALNNEPWRPALQAILARRGFVLVQEAPDLYSIFRAGSPEFGARVQAASEAASVADVVLAAIASNNLAAATERIRTFGEASRKIVRAFQFVPAASSSGTPASADSDPAQVETSGLAFEITCPLRSVRVGDEIPVELTLAGSAIDDIVGNTPGTELPESAEPDYHCDLRLRATKQGVVVLGPYTITLNGHRVTSRAVRIRVFPPWNGEYGTPIKE